MPEVRSTFTGKSGISNHTARKGGGSASVSALLTPGAYASGSGDEAIRISVCLFNAKPLLAVDRLLRAYQVLWKQNLRNLKQFVENNS